MLTAQETDIRKGVKQWVNGWNAIPTSAVEIILRHEGIYAPLNVPEDELKNMHGFPCAWGTMWAFDSSLDEEWALEHLDELYDIGVIVYESEHLGVVFGIDGAGYDFYDAHWDEMYKLRGLQWHLK